MNTPSPSRPHLFGLLAGLFLATGISFASVTLSRAWTRIHESQLVEVSGSARRNVRADLVIWRANFSAAAPTLLEAQQQLQADGAKVSAFLQLRGLPFAAGPAQIAELTAKKRNEADKTTEIQRVGYRLTQEIEVRSAEVERVPRLAGETSELLQQNIAFVSEGFAFIYTKVGEAKVEMMADATRDARARAEQIAQQGGRQLDGLRTARMGVVQINPLYSGATSWEGNNDTRSLDKTIIASVNATFALK
jgi:hypothetical protein